MFFVFCRKCFAAKKKKKSIHAESRKEQREKKLVHFMPSKEKAKTYAHQSFWIALQKKHETRTRARAHIVII